MIIKSQPILPPFKPPLLCQAISWSERIRERESQILIYVVPQIYIYIDRERERERIQALHALEVTKQKSPLKPVGNCFSMKFIWYVQWTGTANMLINHISLDLPREKAINMCKIVAIKRKTSLLHFHIFHKLQRAVISI